jgi:hypothetical protein
MNITLPKELAARLKDKPNKSGFIAEAVRRRLDTEDDGRKLDELAKAYRRDSLESRDLIKEWDRLAGEGL